MLWTKAKRHRTGVVQTINCFLHDSSHRPDHRSDSYFDDLLHTTQERTLRTRKTSPAEIGLHWRELVPDGPAECLPITRQDDTKEMAGRCWVGPISQALHLRSVP